jgi:hypothetical protein
MTTVVREYTTRRNYTLKDGTVKSYEVKYHRTIKKPVSYRKLNVLMNNITNMETLLELEKWLKSHQPEDS